MKVGKFIVAFFFAVFVGLSVAFRDYGMASLVAVLAMFYATEKYD